MAASHTAKGHSGAFVRNRSAHVGSASASTCKQRCTAYRLTQLGLCQLVYLDICGRCACWRRMAERSCGALGIALIVTKCHHCLRLWEAPAIFAWRVALRLCTSVGSGSCPRYVAETSRHHSETIAKNRDSRDIRGRQIWLAIEPTARLHTMREGVTGQCLG